MKGTSIYIGNYLILLQAFFNWLYENKHFDKNTYTPTELAGMFLEEIFQPLIEWADKDE